LSYKLDSENTIPLKQRFLFPKSFGGIIRDVYIHVVPNITISEINTNYSLDNKGKKLNLKINAKIENREFVKKDSLLKNNEFLLRISLFAPGLPKPVQKLESEFSLNINKDRRIEQNISISDPVLWSPENPESYLINIELWRGEGLLDQTAQSCAFYSLTVLKDSLLLNGRKFTFEGTTLVPSFEEFGPLLNYSVMEQDIRIIKETGFNSVRFINSIPHPYYLELCRKYGVLAFIEIPLSNIPQQLADNSNFIQSIAGYLSSFVKAYRKYSAVAAIGIGSSYIPSLEEHIKFAEKLGEAVKEAGRKLVYASFCSGGFSSIPNIDLYGIEILNTGIQDKKDEINKAQEEIGTGRVFISSASYPVNLENSDGYINPHSFEAQAKFFEDLINYSEENPLAGYFINTMFDYRGDYASLIAGYNEKNLYQIGITGENRKTDRLSYKVIYAKLHNQEEVTIPIGSKKDDSPMIFIVFGLILALLMGALVNSGRKFREDSSRALLRPYNFFADVRDQRIISGFHTIALAFISAASFALITSNLLYYFKEDIFLEKILLSFGSHGLIKTISYLAWHPTLAILWLTFASFILMFLLIIIVKIASFFVRNRVYFLNVYYAVIWSLLPVVLLIPVGIVLYRLLNAGAGNIYVYFGLVVFALWIFYRLMKGIYVIFDVNPGSVYFYSIALVLILLTVILVYYEFSNSIFYYLQLALATHSA
ncbi:MAG TPA: glycoside hydrolase family 2 TIM barrel-domain containing protein, partial [Ignavibacteriaceae bacterium]|nr:glycoside hydrolase family 2 TIM barrel-domain containing protein [Ignavibacteriaceae bacterium]